MCGEDSLSVIKPLWVPPHFAIILTTSVTPSLPLCCPPLIIRTNTEYPHFTGGRRDQQKTTASHHSVPFYQLARLWGTFHPNWHAQVPQEGESL